MKRERIHPTGPGLGHCPSCQAGHDSCRGKLPGRGGYAVEGYAGYWACLGALAGHGSEDGISTELVAEIAGTGNSWAAFCLRILGDLGLVMNDTDEGRARWWLTPYGVLAVQLLEGQP